MGSESVIVLLRRGAHSLYKPLQPFEVPTPPEFDYCSNVPMNRTVAQQKVGPVFPRGKRRICLSMLAFDPFALFSVKACR